MTVDLIKLKAIIRIQEGKKINKHVMSFVIAFLFPYCPLITIITP